MNKSFECIVSRKGIYRRMVECEILFINRTALLLIFQSTKISPQYYTFTVFLYYPFLICEGLSTLILYMKTTKRFLLLCKIEAFKLI